MTRNSFYKSDKWEKFRKVVIAERADKEGLVHCAMCGKALLKPRDIQVDHIQELNDANYTDANISLNPDNVQLLCIQCHNKKHERFQGWQKPKPRRVYIVYGAPCAGKSSYVRERAERNDIIVDLDSIWECISAEDRYNKPEALKSIVFSVRDCLYDAIEHRAGKWQNAWVITTAPLIGDRERLKVRVGADELIHIDTDKEACLSRAETEAWAEMVEEYFERYQPDLPPDR